MLQLVAPFNSAGQSVRVGIPFSTPVNLAGKTVVANVEVVYGLAADLAATPAGGRIYVRSGVASVYADTGYQNLDAGGKWFGLSLNASAPAFVDTSAGSYDATDIREIGVEIATNRMATTTTTAVVTIDTVAY
jgi:hypothetical protein